MEIIESGQMLSIKVNRLNEITVDILKETNVYTITATEAESTHDNAGDKMDNDLDNMAVKDNDYVNNNMAEHALETFINNCTVSVQRLHQTAKYGIKDTKSKENKENNEVKLKKTLKMSKLCKGSNDSAKSGKKFNLKILAIKKGTVIKKGMKKCFRPKTMTSYLKIVKKCSPKDSQKSTKDTKKTILKETQKGPLKEEKMGSNNDVKKNAPKKYHKDVKKEVVKPKGVVDSASKSHNKFVNLENMVNRIRLQNNTQGLKNKESSASDEAPKNNIQSALSINSCCYEENHVKNIETKKKNNQIKQEAKKLSYPTHKIKQCSVRMVILKAPFEKYLLNEEKGYKTESKVRQKRKAENVVKEKKHSRIQASQEQETGVTMSTQATGSDIGLER